jgi:hypothetical protein
VFRLDGTSTAFAATSTSNVPFDPFPSEASSFSHSAQVGGGAFSQSRAGETEPWHCMTNTSLASLPSASSASTTAKNKNSALILGSSGVPPQLPSNDPPRGLESTGTALCWALIPHPSALCWALAWRYGLDEPVADVVRAWWGGGV